MMIDEPRRNAERLGHGSEIERIYAARSGKREENLHEPGAVKSRSLRLGPAPPPGLNILGCGTHDAALYRSRGRLPAVEAGEEHRSPPVADHIFFRTSFVRLVWSPLSPVLSVLAGIVTNLPR